MQRYILYLKPASYLGEKYKSCTNVNRHLLNDGLHYEVLQIFKSNFPPISKKKAIPLLQNKIFKHK